MADLLALAFLFTHPLAATPAHFRDHGVHGKTYPIEEDNLLDYIKNRMNQQDQNVGKEIYNNLSPVSGLSEATLSTTHYFDPTIVALADIIDQKNNIVIPKGTTYNPLEYFSLVGDLLFFDGEQEAHIQWAKSQQSKTKWILVRGRPFDLEKEEYRPVFFDQHGLLVQKLSITTIPAKVTQEGLRLKIEACPLQEHPCAS